jgi:hypothetical protein
MRKIVSEGQALLAEKGYMRPDGTAVTVASMSSEDFCKLFVLSKTTPQRCALVALYKSQNDANGKPFIASASVFVSHAWQNGIADVLDVMEQYESAHPNSYFWFDIVIVNQNIVAEIPEDWWSTTFRDSIK